MSESESMQCPFCQIVEGKIPAERIYDSERVIAFLDIAPAAKGHVLLVTKAHHQSAIEVPNETLQEIALAMKKIISAMKKIEKGKEEGVNVLINDGKVAGQLVEHFHIHIIPREKGDGLSFEWGHKKYEAGEIKEWRDRLKKALI